MYDPDDRVSDGVWACVNEMWNAYLDYWELQNLPDEPELDEQGREFMRRFKELGESLRPALFSLSPGNDVVTAAGVVMEAAGADRDLKESKAIEVVQGFANYWPLRDCLRLSLAFVVSDELLPRAEERLPVLLGLLRSGSLSERASAYLDRATRLFLWGFDAECTVMCHSVLEAALSERFPDEVVWGLGIRKSGREYTSRDLIRAAQATEVLSSEDVGKAHQLRVARNDTVHAAPETTDLAADEAMENLCLLLDRLFPADE